MSSTGDTPNAPIGTTGVTCSPGHHFDSLCRCVIGELKVVVVEQPIIKTQLVEKHCGCGFDLSTYDLEYSWGGVTHAMGYYTFDGVDYCLDCWKKQAGWTRK